MSIWAKADVQLDTGVVWTRSVSDDETKTLDAIFRPWLRGNSGEVCRRCGGMMIQTGTCHTCTQCGETTGCG